MIQSISIIPQDDLWKNQALEQATGLGIHIECVTKEQDTEFGIFIECGSKDADEIFNLIKLIKKMTDRRYSIESEKEDDD